MATAAPSRGSGNRTSVTIRKRKVPVERQSRLGKRYRKMQKSSKKTRFDVSFAFAMRLLAFLCLEMSFLSNRVFFDLYRS